MVLSLIFFIIIGLIAGYVARAVVPGPDPMGIVGTLLLGIVGSFVGGFLWNLLFGGGDLLATSGLIGSIIGAIIALLIYRAVNKRTA
ncbi:MAG: GlsB/YeaQ/YmgE family stress response membrane protein [Actinobacteria bacterium]|nr:GlsB/YeaQ/YmgE family stress response membrane protein [Actinomycetota bacterium]